MAGLPVAHRITLGFPKRGDPLYAQVFLGPHLTALWELRLKNLGEETVFWLRLCVRNRPLSQELNVFYQHQ